MLHSFSEQPIAKSISGKIEVEDYFYSDGNLYENIPVKTEITSDKGGKNVCNIDKNDWMLYKVEVSQAGNYLIDYKVAFIDRTIQFDLMLDETVIDSFSIAATRGNQICTC